MVIPRPLPALLLAAATAVAACSPTLDWREARPDGSGATLMFPCKPGAQVRPVRLAGRVVPLAMHACSAGGVTWALSFADLGDPAAVSGALDELRRAAIANVGAAAAAPLALAVPGATPNPASTRVRIDGHLPDGRAVQEQVALFTRGTMVFQAAVIGARLPADGVETFFGALQAGA